MSPPLARCLAFTALLGCDPSPHDAPPPGDEIALGPVPQALLRGEPDLQTTAVVALARSPEEAFCSGVLIAPRLVLTAAHCVDEDVAADVGVYEGVDPAAADRRLAVSRIVLHPGWDRFTGAHDLAVLVLVDRLPPPAFPMARRSAPALSPGDALELVAYGHDGPQAHAHQRRRARAAVASAGPDTFQVEVPGGGVCPGDSGSPAFLLQPGGPVLVGVLSRGAATCSLEGSYTRVYEQEVFLRAMQAWATDGTREHGARCLDDGHCASGVCARAPDDGDVTYCSDACEHDDQCRPGMRCRPAPGGSRCLHAGPTPGAQGAACQQDRDCVSGRCGGWPGTCTVRCHDADSICDGAARCEIDHQHGGERSCLLPAVFQQPACALGRAPSDGPPPAALGLLVVLAALALALRRWP